MRKDSIRLARPKLTLEEERRLITAWDDGVRYSAIRERFQIDNARIAAILAKHGRKPRTAGRRK